MMISQRMINIRQSFKILKRKLENANAVKESILIRTNGIKLGLRTGYLDVKSLMI